MNTVTFKRHKTDDGENEYRSADGRFVITRIWRSAQRGPGDRVSDGFLVIDQLTDAGQRREILADAKSWAERALRNAEEFKDANVVKLTLSPDFGLRRHGGITLAEVWGVDAAGKRHYAGMVNARDIASGREHLAAMLDSIGRGDLMDTAGL